MKEDTKFDFCNLLYLTESHVNDFCYLTRG